MEKVSKSGKEMIIPEMIMSESPVIMSESPVATSFLLTKLRIKLWLKRHTSAKSEVQRDKHFTCMSMYG